MEDILTLEDLKKALTLEGVTDYEEAFKKIADALLNRFAIRKGDNYYRFVEIEFYHSKTDEDTYRENNVERTLTYKRKANAGEWFFHPSGVDITFASDGNCNYGGILIRSIVMNSNFFCGPYRVEDELFGKFNAFESPNDFPQIVAHHFSKENFNVITRWGIKPEKFPNDFKKLYGYCLPNTFWTWESMKYSTEGRKQYQAYPWDYKKNEKRPKTDTPK